MLSFPLFLYFSYHDVMDLHKLSRNRMQIISFFSGKSIQCTVDKSLIISMCLSFVFKQTAMVTVYSNWWRIRFRFTVSSQSYSGDPWKKNNIKSSAFAFKLSIWLVSVDVWHHDDEKLPLNAAKERKRDVASMN